MTAAEPLVKICPACGEPVVFTFKFRGAEYHCPTCKWCGGVFAVDEAAATRERVARAAAVLAAWQDAEGITPARQDIDPPTCDGCGTVAEGPFDHSGKPSHWYSRTKDGVTQYACSRACIPQREVIAPW